MSHRPTEDHVVRKCKTCGQEFVTMAASRVPQQRCVECITKDNSIEYPCTNCARAMHTGTCAGNSGPFCLSWSEWFIQNWRRAQAAARKLGAKI